MKRHVGPALGAVVCLLSGCGAERAPRFDDARGAESQEITPLFSKSCARRGTTPGPLPDRGARQGSSVALARLGEGLVAYVADHDRNRVVMVDVVAQKVLGSTDVSGAPEQVIVLDDGRVVASVGNGRHLEVFEAGNASLQRLCAREVPAGPFGLAVSPDGGTLAVTSAWDPALTVFDTTLSPRLQRPLPRAPRGVLVDAKQRAFVTHLAGSALSVVPLAGGELDAIELGVRAGSPVGKEPNLRKLRKGSQAYALASVEVLPGRTIIDSPEPVEPRIVVPMVSMDPGEPGSATEFYYGPPPVAGVPKAAPVAVVVDPVARRALTSHVVATTGGQRARECNLPRAVAAHPREPKLYVACEGLDELLELDARAADPMRTVRRRFQTPAGPTGVAVAGREGLAVVFGQFDEELAVIPLDDKPALTIRLEYGTPNLSAAAIRGRALFYRSDDLRITRDGMACSSCHPDGAEDSLTWITPDGPRQTIMLAGRLAGTAPFGWTRHQDTLEEYVNDTCRRLGGHGLSKEDLGDLVAFIKEMPGPPGPRSSRPELVAEGKSVFRERGCGTCHLRATGVDGQQHAFDRVAKESIDTPSLRDVGRTAPYFHDGRYATLDDLLADNESRMGMTSALSRPERAALRAFLESL